MVRFTTTGYPEYECGRCSAECDDPMMGVCWVRGAVDRLAAYENTGMTPVEIVAMRARVEVLERLLAKEAEEPKQTACSNVKIRTATPASDRFDRSRFADLTYANAPVAGIPAPANRPLTLDEVLALPEGTKVWVEERGDYLESRVHTRSGQDLVDDSGMYYDLYSKGWFLDGERKRVDCRVWSLPQEPTQAEKDANPWKEGAPDA